MEALVGLMQVAVATFCVFVAAALTAGGIAVHGGQWPPPAGVAAVGLFALTGYGVVRAAQSSIKGARRA